MKVTNIGKVVGSEVVQIYVTPSSTTVLSHPIRTLRGFGRAKDLSPGDSAIVEVSLDKQALSYWCVVEERWKIEAGTYGVIVGSDAATIKLQAEIKVNRETFWQGI